MSLGPLKAAIPAIIAAPYGGEMGATALSHVLFGTYNPSGKLAATMYPPDYINQLPLTDMSLTTPPGRTHLFYTGTPEYAFGDGLSYTTWELEWETRPPAKWKAMVEEEEEERVKFSVRVRNTGSRAGRRTVLVFARPVDAGGGDGGRHLQQKLVAFDGVASVEPSGGEGRLEFALKPNEVLARSDEEGVMSVWPGKYEVVVRDGSNEIVHAFVV